MWTVEIPFKKHCSACSVPRKWLLWVKIIFKSSAHDWNCSNLLLNQICERRFALISLYWPIVEPHVRKTGEEEGSAIVMVPRWPLCQARHSTLAIVCWPCSQQPWRKLFALPSCIQLTVHHRVKFVQSPAGGASFVMYLPVFLSEQSSGVDNTCLRVGCIYCPFKSHFGQPVQFAHNCLVHSFHVRWCSGVSAWPSCMLIQSSGGSLHKQNSQ